MNSEVGIPEDDSIHDYRRLYSLPVPFLWREEDWARIDYDGYWLLATQLLPSPPARILDAGCGCGMGARRLVDAGYTVTGVDFNERGTAYARIFVPEAEFICADLRELTSVGDKPFDAATCIEVLEHVPPADRLEVLRSIHKAIKPGGTLVLSTPSPRMYPNPKDYERARLADLRHDLSLAGFAVSATRFQHRDSPVMSPRVWRFITNSHYDLLFLRRFARRLFLRWFNEAPEARKSRRYIIRAERSE
jgi:2-polyprenyl-3-methyl-5-hydroxy-6-metoxy-1,4-benzoquinol methylase